MANTKQTPIPATHKDYVAVFAKHDLNGRIQPVAYQLKGDVPVKIDIITDERQAASLKSGGQGTRYTCKVTVGEVQSDIYLFHDEELWFMEPILQQTGPVCEPAHVQLRKQRREAGISQNELARALGMDVLDYCRLEGGVEMLTEELFMKICQFLSSVQTRRL